MTLAHLFLTLVLVAVWGFNFVVIKVGLVGIPPLLLCSARFFLASLPALFFIKRPPIPLKMLAGYGLVMFTLQFALMFMGIYAGVTAGIASLLTQAQVFFTVLMGVLFFGNQVHPWQILGALVAFSGIALVGRHVEGGVTLSGFCLVIASTLFFGLGSVISKKIGKVDRLALVVWASLFAWPPLLLLSFFIEGTDAIVYSLSHLTWSSVSSVLYITFLSTLFGYGVWSFLLHHYSLALVAPFTLLVPIFAILGSVFVLGEPFQSWKISAAILIILGLCINFLGPWLSKRNSTCK